MTPKDTAEAFLRMYNVPAYESVPQLVSTIVDTDNWPPDGSSAVERIYRPRNAFAREFECVAERILGDARHV